MHKLLYLGQCVPYFTLRSLVSSKISMINKISTETFIKFRTIPFKLNQVLLNPLCNIFLSQKASRFIGSCYVNNALLCYEWC